MDGVQPNLSEFMISGLLTQALPRDDTSSKKNNLAFHLVGGESWNVWNYLFHICPFTSILPISLFILTKWNKNNLNVEHVGRNPCGCFLRCSRKPRVAGSHYFPASGVWVRLRI